MCPIKVLFDPIKINSNWCHCTFQKAKLVNVSCLTRTFYKPGSLPTWASTCGRPRCRLLSPAPCWRSWCISPPTRSCLAGPGPRPCGSSPPRQTTSSSRASCREPHISCQAPLKLWWKEGTNLNPPSQKVLPRVLFLMNISSLSEVTEGRSELELRALQAVWAADQVYQVSSGEKR